MTITNNEQMPLMGLLYLQLSEPEPYIACSVSKEEQHKKDIS
jgi:hypothetical protein